MALSANFEQYLRKRRSDATRRALAAALEADGYRLEAALLERCDEGMPITTVDIGDGVWDDRRAWVGTHLPESATTGDIWLDVCELTPMVLVPWHLDPPDPAEYAPGVLERLPAHVAWLALRPVLGWQFAAFLRVARTKRNRTRVRQRLKPLDGHRILADGEHAPVRSLMYEEAGLYATWFWKRTARRSDWQAAVAAFSHGEVAALWGPPHREWAGSVVEGIASVVSPDTVEADPHEALDDEEHWRRPDRILYGEFEAPPDVTTRTAVSIQSGLGTGENPLSVLDIGLGDFVDRS